MPGRTASTQGQYAPTAASTETKVRSVAPPSSSSRSPGHRTTSRRSIISARPSRRGRPSRCRGRPSRCRGRPSRCRGRPSRCRVTHHTARQGDRDLIGCGNLHGSRRRGQPQILVPWPGRRPATGGDHRHPSPAEVAVPLADAVPSVCSTLNRMSGPSGQPAWPGTTMRILPRGPWCAPQGAGPWPGGRETGGTAPPRPPPRGEWRSTRPTSVPGREGGSGGSGRSRDRRLLPLPGRRSPPLRTMNQLTRLHPGATGTG